MSFLSRLTEAVRAVLAPKRTTAPGRPTRPDRAVSPGQDGPSATVEVDPRQIGKVRMTYSPSRDGAPDPGEIVWTWVPFEERDGRGKDRPVLVVATEPAGTFLAVQLTSKQHQGADFVPIGSGAWDSAGRPSWVIIDRVFRVHAAGMRRESAGLPVQSFTAVESRLRQRYGWR
ncbi:MAG TPA: type II toxin-antitoxin system PemK/MazF family toxin [Nakamurella sp.]